jgi:hypothetical protein
LYEDAIREAFVGVFNSFINNKEEILKSYYEIIEDLIDTTKLDNEGVKLKSELVIEDKRLERRAKRERMAAFIKELEQRDGLITEFDEELWNGTVDKVVVYCKDKVTFVFKDGMEIDWDI